MPSRRTALRLKSWLHVLIAIAAMVFGGGARADVLTVTGTGADDTTIPARTFPVRPNAVYGVRCKVRHPEGPANRGIAVIGLLGCNDYLHVEGNDWIARSFVVPSSATATEGRCTVRQWHLAGRTEFDALDIAEVTPVYRPVGDVRLGYGESVDGPAYHFGLKLGEANHGHSRALVSYRNLELRSSTPFGARSEMRFAHTLGARDLTAGWLSVLCQEGTSGRLVAEVSRDGTNWTEVVAVTNMNVARLKVPSSFFPTRRLLTRVRGEGRGCNLKLRQYAFDATFSGPGLFGFGATEYRRVDDGKTMLTVRSPAYLDDIVSGARLHGAPAGVTAWEQSSGRKVFRRRPVPTSVAAAFTLATARNEAEAKQLVLTAEAGLRGARVSGEIDDEITVEVERVGYQFVDYAADEMGARGDWPDPIFPQERAGVDIRAGENQPFWVRVKPTTNARAGVHCGRLRVRADGVDFAVPLEVTVFDFAFPDRLSCESAFGLTWQTVYDYQRLSSPADKRTVTEKYLAHFARHHIAPYHPFPMSRNPSWTMRWTKPEDPRDAEPVFDWAPYDAEVERVLAAYRFNTFMFTLRDLGGGDYDGTHGKAKMNGAEQGTELYERYAERYLKAVEAHLKEKGWLETAYAYVYDEPRPEHYAYVNENLRRIARYAPGIRRMVTVEPRAEFGDNVSLWCPQLELYDGGKARARRAKGDGVWWYITDWSRAPKVNEHIEHSGVDMRVWLWQTWREQLTGILIWETVHWNGRRVYPDPARRQNPYRDSICWGGRRPWNTGEGRYVYPPPACFETTGPVLEGPVDSIRFEMLREGLEDFEYFALLKKRDPKHPLLVVPPAVTTSPTEYSLDPAAMEAHRLRLARALEGAR